MQDSKLSGLETNMSPLFSQRFCWVQEFIEKESTIRTVTDVGCGNGQILNWFKTIGQLEVVNFIDKDGDMLERNMERFFRPNMLEILFGRKNSEKKLDINVFRGEIADPDDRLSSDCFSLVEVIQHVTLDHLPRVTRAIFGYHQPRYVIVTTPNREISQLLEQIGAKIRDNSQNFEWTRQEFVHWADGICLEFTNYQVTFHGVGQLPGSEPYGPCSQIALFTRTGELRTKIDADLDCLDLSLSKLSVEKDISQFAADEDVKGICLISKFTIPANTHLQATDATLQVKHWDEMDDEDIECVPGE